MDILVRRRKGVMFAVIFSIVSLFSVSASAVEVVWYLDGVTFDDGSTAEGSFTFDADSNTYSAFNITTTPGTIVTETYSFDLIHPTIIGCSNSDTLFCVVSSAEAPLSTGDGLLQLVYDNLTNAGGTVNLGNATQFGVCSTDACGSWVQPSQRRTSGQLTSNAPPQIPPPTESIAAPVPTLSIYGLGLTVLGLTVIATRRLSRRKVRQG